MTETMLAEVICQKFERAVGKNQDLTCMAMHVGFDLCPSSISTDQYQVIHMYIFAPMNYVYVAIQTERIDRDGKRHVGPMDILSYHDSCWRDAVQMFICKRSEELSGFRSFRLGEWYDVIGLTQEEKDCLKDIEMARRANHLPGFVLAGFANPFDRRGIWAGKA